ncbi:23S rRNA pseudouridine1911/1915/1917 synthase [Aequitasia blattaphilus]|uniref:RNA pseudouridylate synthase n=1 Tax=Aequitasia blattaphilus TaxID=2949332 RepID=A0ABT1EAC0_9FIRM|nr:RluA family pseudouridine synthase [Aequitasia blattaphilus]MCP1102564.1 RluA family pseudouridine synthase [Aequitasia blattaphilus]MCR8615204.1 RluA family pseudouridine synthase [Aequitasia blattaphilus]
MYPDLEILYEDKDIIVCVKPHGVPTQSKSIMTKDMVSLLKNYLNSPYLGLIHRLDQPVKGIMVFGKTPLASKNLSKSLTANSFQKLYLATVHGKPAKDTDTLTDYLLQDKKSNTSSVVSPGTPGQKRASLSYKLLDFNNEGNTSLLEVSLETGRHHQIRVQLSHIGHPIVGDRKYGQSTDAGKNIQLVAYKLSFPHPATGKRLSFSIS